VPTPTPPRSPDDHRPGWYRWLERAFDAALGGSVLLIWFWGLLVFLLVGWGLWLSFFK
jgi:hypothetical protein